MCRRCIYWLELSYGVGITMVGGGVDGRGDMRLNVGIAYCGLVRIMNIFPGFVIL